MARIDDVFITGTMGNVVFYRRMGKPCVRVRREHIKQTGATKKRGENFGIAARAGKRLRSGLIPVMPNPTDRSMQSRFSGAIAKWLGQSDVPTLQPCEEIPFVSSFQFTEGVSFGERFKVPIVTKQPTSNIVSIIIGSFIPSQNIAAPAGTLRVKLIIAVSSTDLAIGLSGVCPAQVIDIPYNETEIPAKEMDFQLYAVEGNIILTAARLVYFGAKGNPGLAFNNEAFNPAGVIDAQYHVK